MPRLIQAIQITVLVCSLTACVVGPNYVKPEIQVPIAFKEQIGWNIAQPKDEQLRGQWWEIFGDNELNKLVTQVEVSNQNLKAAEAQFRQARAITQQSQASYFPAITGGISATRNKLSGSRNNTSNYNLNMGASWEPDIWGRIHRVVEASNAGLQASAADLESAKLSAQTTLVQDYFLLRISDARKMLLDNTVANYEKSLKLTQNQFAVGVAAHGDVVAAETQLKSAKAQAVDVGAQRAQLEHAIATLMGKPPADFSIEPASKPFVTLPPEIPLGIPSKLLERRSDIAAAERRAAQANAQIGVSEASFYPNLTLSATLGLQSPSFANWLTAPARFWTLGPALAQSIFDGGLRKAQSEQAIALYDQNVANYRQSVLSAFQEVEDNLAALRILEQEAQLQDDAVKSANESLQISLNQYKAGTITYLNVVNVETIALNNELSALNIQSRRLTAAVLLITALGGGWNATEQNNESNSP